MKKRGISLIIVLTVLTLFIMPSLVSAWLDGYDYRSQIDFTGVSAVTTQEVNLTKTANMLSNCSNIAFANSTDGLLNQTLRFCNDTIATFWVKVPNNLTIWEYHDTTGGSATGDFVDVMNNSIQDHGQTMGTKDTNIPDNYYEWNNITTGNKDMYLRGMGLAPSVSGMKKFAITDLVTGLNLSWNGTQTGLSYVWNNTLMLANHDYRLSMTYNAGALNMRTTVPTNIPNNNGYFTWMGANTFYNYIVIKNFSVSVKFGTGMGVSVGSEEVSGDSIYPQISIDYPLSQVYTLNVSRLNYTVSDNINLSSCWYSLDSGLTNTTITCGENLTDLTSVGGTNTWTVWAKDTSYNINSSSVTFVIIENTTTINNLTTIPSPVKLANNLRLQANVSSGDSTNISWCNFTLEHPSGVLLINNLNASSINGQLHNSTLVHINMTGLYEGNVTCSNNYGVRSFSNISFNVDYNLNYQTNYSLVVKRIELRNETVNLTIKLSDDTNSSIRYNINATIDQPDNLTIRLSSYNLTLDSGDSFSNPYSVIVYINASNSIANGTYSGNISFSNSTYNLTYYSYFTYGIYPPGGTPTIKNLTGNISCNDNPSGICAYTESITQGSSKTLSYVVSNTGYWKLGNCTPSLDNDFIGESWYSFSDSLFSLDINESKIITTTFSPVLNTSSGGYNSHFHITCSQGDFAGNPVGEDDGNDPFVVVIVTPYIAPISIPGGGGGGETVDYVTVIALIKPINDSIVYIDLQRAILYKAIYDFCDTQKCDLTETQTTELSSILDLDYDYEITNDVLKKWVNQYNKDQIENVRIERSVADKYSLIEATIEIIESDFILNPKQVQAWFFQIFSETYKTKVYPSKLIASAKIVEGEGWEVEVSPEGDFAVITYTIQGNEKFIQTYYGKAQYLSKSGDPRIQNLQISVIKIDPTMKNIVIYMLIPLIFIGIFAYVYRGKLKRYFKKK